MSTTRLTVSIPLAGQNALAGIQQTQPATQSVSTNTSGQSGTDTILDLLTEALSQALLKKQDDSDGGANFNNPGDNPLMDIVAHYMDDNQDKYGSANDAAGNAQSWGSEVYEDDELSEEELADFNRGLRGILEAALGGYLHLGSGSTGSSNDSADSGGGAVDVAVGGVDNSSNDSSGDSSNGSAEVPNTGGGSDPVSESEQDGIDAAEDFVRWTGSTGLANIDLYGEGDNRYFVNKEDRDKAKDIGQFMDKHPEVFKDPEYQKDGSSSLQKSNQNWAGILSSPSEEGMTEESKDEFQKAVQMLIDVLALKELSSAGLQDDAETAANSVMTKDLMERLGN